MQRPYLITHDLSSDTRTLGYDFDMATVFYAQVNNNLHPCKIEAEKIAEPGDENTNAGRLLFKNEKGEVVGTFRSSSVIGWWKPLR